MANQLRSRAFQGLKSNTSLKGPVQPSTTCFVAMVTIPKDVRRNGILNLYTTRAICHGILELEGHHVRQRAAVKFNSKVPLA